MTQEQRGQVAADGERAEDIEAPRRQPGSRGHGGPANSLSQEFLPPPLCQLSHLKPSVQHFLPNCLSVRITQGLSYLSSRMWKPPPWT